MANSALNKTIVTDLTDFNAPMTITATGTQDALQINGNSSGSPLTIIQNAQLSASDYCLYVNTDNDAHLSPAVVYFRQNDTGATADCVRIFDNGDANALWVNKGGGSGGTALTIDNDSTQHGLYIQQDGVLDSSKNALRVYSNTAQNTSPLVEFHNNASSSQPVLQLTANGTGDPITAYGNAGYLPYPWIKSGSFTRDMSTANGTQAITGVGFKGRAIWVFAVNRNTANQVSWGFSDGSTDDAVDNRENGYGAGRYGSPDVLINMVVSGPDVQQGSLSSFDADGFTISWSKSGSPTGTATCNYIVLG